MAEIRAGQISVAEALKPIGREPAPFFRFPYLADRASLRQRIANQGVVAIDVDVDSKDYFQTSASLVASRTILDLEKHGRGIILFHDIHERTVDMLPDLLAPLQSRGFKVVRLVPAGGAPLLAAESGRARALRTSTPTAVALRRVASRALTGWRRLTRLDCTARRPARSPGETLRLPKDIPCASTRSPAARTRPNDINVIIECPIGGHPIKYEMDKEAGALFVDRFLYTPMTYPGNYGFVPTPCRTTATRSTCSS